MMLEGAFRAHSYTEAETNKETGPLEPEVIQRNAELIELWYKRALTNNLRTNDVDTVFEEPYDQFSPLKKKYVDMADDYAFLPRIVSEYYAVGNATFRQVRAHLLAVALRGVGSTA